MLCRLCETFLTNLLHQEFSTWRRVQQGWFTFKHGGYATVQAAAESGCEVCTLFNEERHRKIHNYAELVKGKWGEQAASIDVKYGLDDDDGKHEDHFTPRWSFQLLTVGPEMSWLPFELYYPGSPQETPQKIPQNDQALDLRLTTAVSKSSDTPRSVEIATRWISQCVENHQSCRPSKRSPLPTRLIDVSAFQDTLQPRLQVNRGQLGQYVTLSHCWGTGDRLTLTKDRLSAFKDAIPFSQLPKTFQDAIHLTALLGVRYIWIDALCILQDDKEDWRKESALMGSIFENALFSLSALSAEDSHAGILQQRTTLEARTEIDGTRLGVRTRLPSLSEALTTSKLESRAWCFQERLLARAILHVGPEQLYWECSSRTFVESRPSDDGLRNNSQSSASSLRNRLKGSSPASDQSFWLRLVIEYSARSITKPADRLPAIAGLASRETHNRFYMQGLWSGEEHMGLLWRRQKLTHSKVVPSRDKYYSRTSSRNTARPFDGIASSWSWASINDAVEFPLCDTFPVRREKDTDAFFEYEGGSLGGSLPFPGLKVYGVLKRGSCKQSSAKGDQATFRSSGSTISNEGVACVVDYPNEPVSRGCYSLRIATWAPDDAKGSNKQRATAEKASYLILERMGHGERTHSSEGPATFTRIGMGFDSVAKVDKIFINADRRHLVLV